MKLLYSNDYELFLGGITAHENEVVIKPTEELLAACEVMGAPMTFFVDVLSLIRYRELGKADFPDAVSRQMCDAISRGHDVQNHIHPHWPTTKLVSKGGNTMYRFDEKSFVLGAADDPYTWSVRLLSEGRSYLEDMIRKTDPAYACRAYRAGGYGLQPNERDVLRAAIDTGHLIDSSIVPGLVIDSSVHHVDFSGCAGGEYRLNENLQPASEGIFEIPVAAGHIPGAALAGSYLKRLATRASATKYSGYGAVAVQQGKTQNSLVRHMTRLKGRVERLANAWGYLELTDDADIMVAITKAYVETYNPQYICFSCHSKSINTTKLKALIEYHKKMKSIFGEELEATTFSALYDEVT
jgi:hypothetical protein